MPQLDSFTYLTQVIWLFVFVFTYYLFLMNNALPTISRLLKLRKQLTAGSAPAELQASDLSFASNTALTSQIAWDVCRLSRQFLSQTVKDSTHWYNQQLSKINKIQFQKLHNKSVAFLGQFSLWLILTSQIFSSANKKQSNRIVSERRFFKKAKQKENKKKSLGSRPPVGSLGDRPVLRSKNK
jgi:hypothetical protein